MPASIIHRSGRGLHAIPAALKTRTSYIFAPDATSLATTPSTSARSPVPAVLQMPASSPFAFRTRMPSFGFRWPPYGFQHSPPASISPTAAFGFQQHRCGLLFAPETRIFTLRSGLQRPQQSALGVERLKSVFSNLNIDIAMPTVSVDQERFLATLGDKFTVDEFEKLCFQFGIELDEIVTASAPGERDALKMDIPANCCDLLCHEDISRAFLVYLDKIEVPKYRLVQPKELCQITISPDIAKIRPYFAGAYILATLLSASVLAAPFPILEPVTRTPGRRRCGSSRSLYDCSWDYWRNPNNYRLIYPGYPGQGTL
ncbi:unnamed protein product [Tilletia controversa]|nr:unnamed protein product [Tilletia controversa]